MHLIRPVHYHVIYGFRGIMMIIIVYYAMAGNNHIK